MHYSLIILLLLASLAQTCTWTVRKKLLNVKKLSSETQIVMESLVISFVVFTYIILTKDTKKMYKEIKTVNIKYLFHLLLIGFGVLIPLISIFYLMGKMEISTLSPTLSILRIIMLTIVGWGLFKENMTIKKIIALVLMITGVIILMNEK